MYIILCSLQDVDMTAVGVQLLAFYLKHNKALKKLRSQHANNCMHVY